MAGETLVDLREAFDKLVAAGKLQRQHVEPLLQLATSGFCSHRSWGFGRITSLDTVFARFTIDFSNKPGHTMDLGFAADSLKAIPRDHILARKASDLEGLKKLAAVDHLELIRLVVQSYDGKATLDQVQQTLVPDVIPQDWRKWWENAKHELKKDGHFQIPSKKSEPITYQEKEVSLDNRLLGAFRKAKGLKAKVNAAIEASKSLEDVQDAKAIAAEIICKLNADIPTHQRTQPAVALEAIFARDDLAATVSSSPQAGELPSDLVWQHKTSIGEILAQVPATKHRRILESFKAANPETWHEEVLGALNEIPAKLCGECANMLIHEGQLDALKQTLARSISHHKASSELLLWLAKERSDSYADILGPEVFRAMMTAMERDDFNEKKSNRLRDFIVDDKNLLIELIESADLDVIKDLTRTLQLSTVFDDMDKRSLLARIVKSYPAIQALISGEQTKQESTLLVSWESLERRRNEYHELVQKKIPANSKEIAIARSYGDLRENHEYKAAKEMQKILMRRKAELEVQLLQARGTDFANPRTDVVSPGTRVNVTELETQHSEAFSVLGAWDTDLDKGIISYLTPMGQALLNHRVGEEVDMESHGLTKRYRIDSIEVCPHAAATSTNESLVASRPMAAAADPAPEAAPVASAPEETEPSPASDPVQDSLQPSDSEPANAPQSATGTTPVVANQMPAPNSQS